MIGRMLIVLPVASNRVLKDASQVDQSRMCEHA